MIAGFAPDSAEFGRDPWPAYAALRRLPGLPWLPGFEGHLAARHEDVRAIASDRRMVRNPSGFATPDQLRAIQVAANFHDMPFHERFVQVSMLEIDGPAHDRLRRAVFASFTRSALAGLRRWLDAQVASLLDEALPRGRFDFVVDLAAHLPGQVIGRLIGTDPALVAPMTAWSEDVVSYFGLTRPPEAKARAEAATRQFHGLLRDLLADRRAAPRDDLTSRLLTAPANERLTEDELIATLMQLLHAGHGSTIDALGNGMAALLAHPSQMRLLRARPDLTGPAVHEMIRFAAPLPFFHRYAAEDLRIAGADWQQGTKFGVLYASANRDPACVPDPDRFDITRQPAPHLAFGAGPHVCLGNNLARLGMEALFAALLARTTAIEADGPSLWKTGLQAHGPLSLPIRVTPARG